MHLVSLVQPPSNKPLPVASSFSIAAISCMSPLGPLISVIMNGYNCQEYLRQSIDSVFSQTYPNWEIVFWDNASSDGTSSIASSYGSRLRYFRGEQTISLGAARNKAIEHARGDFIAFLDTDDFWMPEKLSLQVQHMIRDRSLSLLYGNYYILNQKTGRIRKAFNRLQPSGYVFPKFLSHYPVNLQTVLLRRSALDDLDHHFDARLNLAEEFDLFMRILYHSTAAYTSDPTCVYRVHGEMSSIKHIDLYPLENSLVIEKLIALHPSIPREYPDQVTSFSRKIAYWIARSDMLRHNPARARSVLRPFVTTSFIFLLLYLSTYSIVAWNMLLSINSRLR